MSWKIDASQKKEKKKNRNMAYNNLQRTIEAVAIYQLPPS